MGWILFLQLMIMLISGGIIASILLGQYLDSRYGPM